MSDYKYYVATPISDLGKEVLGDYGESSKYPGSYEFVTLYKSIGSDAGEAIIDVDYTMKEEKEKNNG